MNIDKTNISSGPPIACQTINPREAPANTVSASTIFSSSPPIDNLQRSAGLSSRELTALKSQLSLIGLDIEALDGESILRALTLIRNGAPLDAAQITGVHVKERIVAERLPVLIADAVHIAASKSFPPGIRDAASVLVEDMQAFLFKIGISETAISGTIDQWTDAVIARLAAYFSGDANALSTVEDGSVFSMRFFTGSAGENIDAALPEAIRATVTEARDLLHRTVATSSGTSPDTAAITVLLRERLLPLAGNFLSLSAPSFPMAFDTTAVTSFLTAAIDEFEGMLASLNSADADSGPFPAAATPLMARDALARSGMSFEWRLLAWFRSGGDLGRLSQLIRDDLKGILGSFLGRMKQAKKPGEHSSRTHNLEQTARDLADTITSRQLSAIGERYNGGSRFSAEIPYGFGDGNAWGGLRADRGEDTDGNGKRRTIRRFAFSVETSRLGMVDVMMTLDRGTVDIVVTIENDRGQTVAEETADDVRASLSRHGFTVSSLRFAKKTVQTALPSVDGNSEQNGGVDYRL